MIRVVALTCMLSLFCCAPKPVGQIKGYEYSKHGCTAYPLENYTFYFDESGKALIDVVTREGIKKTFPAPAELPGQIDSLVRKHKLWKLKEGYRPPFQVYDGYSWNLRIRYEENSIYSGGFNAWPGEKLRDGIREINKLLRAVVEAAGEMDVAEPSE